MRGPIYKTPHRSMDASDHLGCRLTEEFPTPLLPTPAKDSARELPALWSPTAALTNGASGVIPWMGCRAWDHGGSDDSRLQTASVFLSARAGSNESSLSFFIFCAPQ